MLTLISLMLIVLSLLGVKQGFAEDFSIIVLPDTQYYSESYPAIFETQAQWIVNNKDALNIVHVAHVGDIVEDWDEQYQWDNADAAMTLLEDPDGVPYSVLPGNHDQPATLYNQYFGINRFQGRSYYGGHYPPGSNDNNYTLFSTSGMDFIVISLGMNPSSNVLDWADARLKEYANRRAIVVSHHLLELDATFGTPGLATYDALKDNPNLFLMLCGHRHGEAKRVDISNGNTIHTLLADYQEGTNGGDGWLRILKFSPLDDRMRVETYSPTLNLYETDSDSQFELSYDMSSSQGDPDTTGTSGDNRSGGGGGGGCFIQTLGM